MNEQEEILVRQSKWSSRRVLLLYWFAIVFIGTGTAVGISASILKPTYSVTGYDHSGISEPWGPDDCVPCHQAEVDGWNLTKHSYILSEFTNATGTYIMHNASDGTNYIYNKTEFLADGGCCHVTRWENTTVDPVTGPVTGDAWFIGISCAACHPEPGEEAQYFMDPGTGFPFQYTCAGRCHLPGSRGSTWAASAHSRSLDDLLATIGEFDYCIHCMTGSSTYEDVTFRSIDCVTCHDPHNEDGVRNDHELRTSTTNELCGTCHTDTYEFRWADIDGSNQVDASFSPGAYAGTKDFIHYSLVNNTVVEAEPDNDSWDLLFTKYIVKVQYGPALVDYPVVGVLLRQGLEGVTVEGIDPSSAHYSDASDDFSEDAAIIGWEWKVSDPVTHQLSLVENISYFVKMDEENIYRIYFTEYDSNNDGLISFKVKPVE